MIRGSYVGIHSAGFRDFLLKSGFRNFLLKSGFRNFLLKSGLTQAADGNGNKKRRKGQDLKPIITT